MGISAGSATKTCKNQEWFVILKDTSLLAVVCFPEKTSNVQHLFFSN